MGILRAARLGHRRGAWPFRLSGRLDPKERLAERASCSAQIEAKIGLLVDRNGGMRVNLPVPIETSASQSNGRAAVLPC